MTYKNRQFDKYGRVSDRFRTDLRNLFEPVDSVPPEVDRAILEQARHRLARPRRIILPLRWAGGIAAAAAVVAIGVFLYRGARSDNHQLSIIHHQSAAAERRLDLDGNGRVDILDAFQLARHVESREPVDAGWDLTGDGRVDREDVDVVAFAAVRLGPDFALCVPPTATEQERWCVIRTLPESRVTVEDAVDEGV